MLYRAIGPLLRTLNAEAAHRLTIRALKLLPRRAPPVDDPILAATLWGRRFANPIGLAAGFDKQAEAIAPLLALGFGFVELGGVTPLPQPGNPKPRVFRLAEDRAVINRYGFNSIGLELFARRLESFRASDVPGLVGINLAKNKDTARAADDFVIGAARLARSADFLVVNVSSPNTPGLRALQSRDELVAIIHAVRAAIASQPNPPLLLKIAPDLGDADQADVAAVAIEQRIDGLVIANTAIARPPGLKSADRSQAGGLSGAPLKPLALAALRAFRRLAGGRMPLIGVGGIASGADAYERIRAGASLVQLYTALVFEGPGLIAQIKRDLAALLRRDGFASVADAVGTERLTN